jgi:hypothetical protein
MGNRDALLSAAKKCLLEKGYNRTTARDIASAAGVSLAAIAQAGFRDHVKQTLRKRTCCSALVNYLAVEDGQVDLGPLDRLCRNCENVIGEHH